MIRAFILFLYYLSLFSKWLAFRCYFFPTPRTYLWWGTFRDFSARKLIGITCINNSILVHTKLQENNFFFPNHNLALNKAILVFFENNGSFWRENLIKEHLLEYLKMLTLPIFLFKKYRIPKNYSQQLLKYNNRPIFGFSLTVRLKFKRIIFKN